VYLGVVLVRRDVLESVVGDCDAGRPAPEVGDRRPLGEVDPPGVGDLDCPVLDGERDGGSAPTLTATAA